MAIDLEFKAAIAAGLRCPKCNRAMESQDMRWDCSMCEFNCDFICSNCHISVIKISLPLEAMNEFIE